MRLTNTLEPLAQGTCQTLQRQPTFQQTLKDEIATKPFRFKARSI